MKIECILQENGYTGKIEYYLGLDEFTPPSKRYNLKIVKDGKQYINRYGLTLNQAKSLFYKWTSKQKVWFI